MTKPLEARGFPGRRSLSYIHFTPLMRTAPDRYALTVTAVRRTFAEHKSEKPMKEPNPIDVHVGRRVRMRRLMLKLSQSKLADQVGVTFQQIQKYERGANRIGSSRLQQIADVLQVPASFFFDDMSENARTDLTSLSFVTEYTSSPDGLRLTKAFSRLNPNIRRCIVDLIEQLASRYPERP